LPSPKIENPTRSLSQLPKLFLLYTPSDPKISRLLIPPLIQTYHHRHNQCHIHPRCDGDRIALPVTQQLPCVEKFPINLRHHLSIALVCDFRLDIEKATVHEEVLFFAIHRVGEVADSFGGAKVEFSFDLEDFDASGRFGKVGLWEREDFFLWGLGWEVSD
jgi:hypothetical protein